MKKLFIFSAAAVIAYMVFSKPEMRRKLSIYKERAKLSILEALEEGQQASQAKEQELMSEVEEGAYTAE